MKKDKQKYLDIPTTHRAFLQCEFVPVFTMKMEKHLLVNLKCIQEVHSKYISSNCSERERGMLLLLIFLCLYGLYLE